MISALLQADSSLSVHFPLTYSTANFLATEVKCRKGEQDYKNITPQHFVMQPHQFANIIFYYLLEMDTVGVKCLIKTL